MPLLAVAGGAGGGSRSVPTPDPTVLSRERVCPHSPGHGLGHPRPWAAAPYPGHLASVGRFNRYFHFCVYRLSLGFELLCFIN